VPLFLPPLAGGQRGRAPLDLAGDGQRRPPDLVEAEAAFEAHVDVHAARARRLGPAAEAVLVQYLAHDQRHPPHVVPGHTRAGIEIDAQLVRMLQVVRAHGMRVEVDAPEIDDPQKLRRVPHDDLLRRASRRERELHRLDPVRPLRGRSLLEKGLALGAVHVPLEHDRSRSDPAQSTLGHRRVVPDEVELRVATPREVHLVRVADRHRAPRRLDHRRSCRAHGPQCGRFPDGHAPRRNRHVRATAALLEHAELLGSMWPQLAFIGSCPAALT
jgi:hypothetical protein